MAKPAHQKPAKHPQAKRRRERHQSSAENARIREAVFPWMLFAFACFLLVAALLKWHQLLHDPFAPRTTLTLIIAAEAGLAIWLLTGAFPIMLRYISILVLFGFAGYNGYQWAHGASECGCFGLLPIHPGITLAMDLVFAAGLLYAKPSAGRSARHTTKTYAVVRSVAFLLAAGFFGLMALMNESSFEPAGPGTDVKAPVATNPMPGPNTAGEAGLKIPEQIIVDLGHLDRAEERIVHVSIPNPSTPPLAITHTHIECQCTEPLRPLTEIAPRHTEQWPIRFIAPNQSTIYRKRILLQTDSDEVPQITVHFHARIGMPIEMLTANDVDRSPLHGDPTDGQSESIDDHILVVNHGNRTVRLLYATTNNPGIVVHVPNVLLETSGSSLLRIEQRQPIPKATPISITLHTDHPWQQRVRATIVIEPREQ